MRNSVGFKTQKWPKKSQKKLQCKKMNRNEQNSQTKSVFWLVAEKIHKLGVSVQGYLGGTLGLRRGQNPIADSKNEFLRPICIFVN